VAVGEVCAGDDAARLANAASATASDKQRAWKSAAEHYRRASTLSQKPSTKIVALNALANLYDATRVNDFNQLELTLRELLALTQTTSRPSTGSQRYRKTTN
jgi:hypothetical protein